MAMARVISMKDYVKSSDAIKSIFMIDPDDIGSSVEIKVRVIKPTRKDQIKLQEYLFKELGAKDEDIKNLTLEEKIKMLAASAQYDAMMISSSIFEPKLEAKNKIFPSPEDALNLSNDLFEKLKELANETKVNLSTGDAEK